MFILPFARYLRGGLSSDAAFPQYLHGGLSSDAAFPQYLHGGLSSDAAFPHYLRGGLSSDHVAIATMLLRCVTLHLANVLFAVRGHRTTPRNFITSQLPPERRLILWLMGEQISKVDAHKARVNMAKNFKCTL